MTRTRGYTISAIGFLLLASATALMVFTGLRVEREKALIYELQQIRTSIQIYQKIHGTKPHNLNEALQTQYKFAKSLNPTVRRNAQNQYIDPFGNTYLYDARTGWVSCSTPKYRTW